MGRTSLFDSKQITSIIPPVGFDHALIFQKLTPAYTAGVCMESHYSRKEVLSYTFLADSSRVLVLK